VATEALDVAAAVLERADGAFLLTRRPTGKVYAGYWEFPGGKIEPGETAGEALVRELHEELGVEVRNAYPWITRVYTYPHSKVRLNFMRVDDWHGMPRPREGQELSWQVPGQPTVSPMLPANAPILKALELPAVYAVTCAGEIGVPALLERLEIALVRGMRLVQVREKRMTDSELLSFAREVAARVHEVGGKVFVNAAETVARRCKADGIHLTAERLRAASTRPDLRWCAASCHDTKELEKAVQIGADCVVLGPVAATLSHPGGIPLGWDSFARLIQGFPLPVYAIGGMRDGDLPIARANGAHGIAMMRGAWMPRGRS
jgi:8-oxo-dGTP diphosphatase